VRLAQVDDGVHVALVMWIGRDTSHQLDEPSRAQLAPYLDPHQLLAGVDRVFPIHPVPHSTRCSGAAMTLLAPIIREVLMKKARNRKPRLGARMDIRDTASSVHPQWSLT